MAVESAFSFLLAIFIFGITPGPGVFASLARALVSGASSAPTWSPAAPNSISFIPKRAVRHLPGGPFWDLHHLRLKKQAIKSSDFSC